MLSFASVNTVLKIETNLKLSYQILTWEPLL